MNNRYIKLKIPFGSKSFIKNIKKGLYLRGNAYFIFEMSKQTIIDEYIEIIESNYRLTDRDMIKPTSYYKDKIVRNFRDNFLDKYSHHNPNNISCVTHKFLISNQTTDVNNYFRSLTTTVKKMFSLLSGSNISGAETNNNASPIRCIDNEYFDCNFANVVKHFSSKVKDKTKDYPQDIKIYSLKEFIENNIIENFDKIFFSYNKDLEYENNELSPIYLDDAIDYETLNKNTKFKLKESQELFIYSIINKSIDSYEEFISSGRLKAKLRSYFDGNVKFCIKNKIIPLHSTITKYNLSNVENAHIIQFASSVDKLTFDDIYLAINPFNCLRIDASTHNLFDKNKIYFDKFGNVFNYKNVLIQSNYLDLQFMPEQTKDIFNIYLENRKLSKSV